MPNATTAHPAPRFAARIAGLTGSVARDILSRAQSSDIISLAGGLPDPALWADTILPPIPPAAFQYGPSEGEPALRRILADRAASLGLPVTADNTLVTSGSQQGLDLAAKLFLSPGTPLILEAPTYLAALQVFHLFQAQLHPLPMDSEGILPATLDQALATTKAPLVYLNPSFQNPTGTCYSAARRAQLAAVLDAHPTVLLEDDPYRELNYGPPAPPPIASHLKTTPWIHLSSVSKTLIPGLRLGSIACSPILYPHLLKLKQAADLHSNRPAQFIAATLLADTAAHAQRLATYRAHYAAKRDALCQALSDTFNSLASWQIPAGGMFVWLRLQRAHDLRAALDRCLANGVAFMPGNPFFASPELHGRYIRLNFTQPTTQAIRQALPIIAASLH